MVPQFHYSLRAFDQLYTNYVIGQEARDDPSSLYPTPQVLEGPTKFEWMKNLRAKVHDTKALATPPATSMNRWP